MWSGSTAYPLYSLPIFCSHYNCSSRAEKKSRLYANHFVHVDALEYPDEIRAITYNGLTQFLSDM